MRPDEFNSAAFTRIRVESDMNLSQPFIQRPKATLLVVLGFLLVGLLAYLQLPLSSLPDVDFPTINVSASMPGASAETVASAVATPLERALGGISGVTSMTSTSLPGQTQIVIQFSLERDIDGAAQDVEAAISSASGDLPKDLPSPPRYRKANPNTNTVVSMAVSSDVISLPDLQDLADNFIARPIERQPGVGVVDFHGEQFPAVRVQVDPRRLAATGLDLEDVRSALALTTVNRPKGSLEDGRRTLTILSNDQLFEAKAFDAQVIGWRNGSPIRVRDIGHAVNAALELKTRAWSQNHPAIIVDVHKQLGAKVDVPALVDRVRAELPGLAAKLPPGVKVEVVADRTQTIRASVHDLELTLVITVALVAFVIFLFLRDLGATLIPGLSIPLSLIGTFPVMYLCGYNLDNISLMGLTLAVGFVVDDAIVVMENITRHSEMGKSRLQAALDGAGEVGFTIVSMTLSLVCVFLPLLLMSGIIGRLFREFSITVSVAVVLSGIISLTQTAVTSSLFLRHKPASRQPSWFDRAVESGLKKMTTRYRLGLEWILQRQLIGLLGTILLAVGSVVLFIAVPKGFVPEQDMGVIFVTTEAAPDIAFRDMCQKQLQYVEIVLRDPDVQNVYSFVEPHPAANVGRLALSLKPFGERKANAAAIMARLRRQLVGVPGMKVYLKAIQDIQVGTNFSKTQYQYVLQDGDVGELFHWAAEFVGKLQALPELSDVASDQNASAAAVAVTVDRDKAASFGITAGAIDEILYDAFGQRQVATVFTALNQHKVILEVQPQWRLDAHSLEVLYLRSPVTGEQVPLSALAHVEATTSPTLINHFNSLPAVTLSFNLKPGYALSQAVAAIQQVEQSIGHPSGLRASFQGSAKAFEESLSSQPLLIAAAIVTMYIILGALYESLIHPITILSSLPSATFGALLALFIFRIDLSVISFIALILLVGIVKKNAIMMVDVAITLQREQGQNARQAIFDACLLRFRPIMMTTFAALLGAVPLALGHGAGSELRRPLGIAIIGGLLVSQSVTLFTVPIIYLYMERVIEWGRRRRGRASPPTAATPSVVFTAANNLPRAANPQV